jgi:hypothetical protein
VPLRLVQPLPDFALSTTASHRIVTGLGHSTFERDEPPMVRSN